MDSRTINQRARIPGVGYKFTLRRLYQKGFDQFTAIRVVNLIGIEDRQTITEYARKIWAPTKKHC